MTTQRPTVRVDGQLMIERGEHVDDMSAFLDDHRWPPSASGQHRPIATSSWRAQEDHFLLDNLGRLCVIWRTTSGRQTVFCPFTDHTAKSAAALLAGRDILYPRDLAAYASATKMTSQHLEGLVQLLQNYRVLRAES